MTMTQSMLKLCAVCHVCHVSLLCMTWMLDAHHDMHNIRKFIWVYDGYLSFLFVRSVLCALFADV